MTDQYEQDVQLDNEAVEEAHDPKNAEAQALDAADKAADAVPTAKKRKGDKTTADNANKKMEKATAESTDVQIDFNGEINSLVESEATLSEEFKAKVGLIFEANVKAKVSEEIDRLEEEYASQLSEEVSATKADLVEKVDSYLNYVVENWMEENQLAIKSGLRAEIAEDFMTGLKDLFMESYVEVPESKVDLVDELHESVEELSEKLNEATEALIKSAAVIESFERAEIIREASKDLAETQIEKLKTVTEDYAVDADFANKVATIKESLFAKPKTNVSEEVEDDNSADDVEISESMQAYVSMLKKSN